LQGLRRRDLVREAFALISELHVNIGVLDYPGAFVPKAHVWASQKLGWLHLRDGAPRFPRKGKGGGDPAFDPEGLL
jgi:hypothetical protein